MLHLKNRYNAVVMQTSVIIHFSKINQNCCDIWHFLSKFLLSEAVGFFFILFQMDFDREIWQILLRLYSFHRSKLTIANLYAY